MRNKIRLILGKLGQRLVRKYQDDILKNQKIEAYKVIKCTKADGSAGEYLERVEGGDLDILK